jgi:CubicO group peptidase (beta-lactamase class C family)
MHIDVDPAQVLARLVDPGGPTPDDPGQPLLGATLVICEGGTLTERTYAAGWARAGGLPMSPDAPMRMASISKLVCAIGAVRLLEQGRIDLDADVSTLVGFQVRNPAFPAMPITMRALLSHTSSLRDGARYWAEFPEPLAALFQGEGAKDRWASEPPGFFKYCNLNYGVVGQAMERAAAERFDALMHRLVFAPLGLTCGYNWSGVPEERRAKAAAIYRKTGPDGETLDPQGAWTAQIDAAPERMAEVPNYRRTADAPPIQTYRLGDNGSLFSPQGGLRASVRDLARIGVDLLHAASGESVIVSRAALATLSSPIWRFDGGNGDSENGFYRAYAPGAQILGKGVFGHFGEAYGLRSGLFVDPGRRRVCAYAINGFSSEPAPGLAPAERILLETAGFAHALA